jgi:predicted transglutaminase-like cysteine proteinase
MAQEKPKRKRPFRLLRRAFAGTLMIATFNGACATPQVPARTGGSASTSADQQGAGGSDPCAGRGGLVFTFESSERPRLLGGETRGVFNNDKSAAEDKWFAMLGRHYSLLQNPANATAYNAWMSQLVPELQSIVAERHAMLADATVAEKAKAVDAVVDRAIRYASDQSLYGPSGAPDDYDYWSSPIETITKRFKDKDGAERAGWGDCEDIGFLKYFGLRFLGVPAEKVYAVYVDYPSADKKDKKDGHIMTMVDITERSGGPQHFMILNNDASEKGNLEEESQRANYRPLYAFNERGPLAFPANIVAWGGPAEQPAACVPAPGTTSQIVRTSKTP